MDIKEFSTLGSCVSRMIFNEKFAPGYKKFIHINFSVEGGSLISLMSKPTSFDKNLLTAKKPFDNTCVENDFSKKYLDFLMTSNIDYIVMDTYFDSSRVLLLKNGAYVTNSARLRRTKLYDNLEIIKIINVYDNLNEFLILWKNACDSFFEFIKDNCKDTKIILNCSRLVYKYKDFNGNILLNKKFMQISHKHNRIRDLLDEYIVKNYDVDILFFDKNTLLDKNHIYGFDPTHYSSEYYPKKLNQIIEIIQRNDYFNAYNHKINKEIRKLKRDNMLLNFKNTKFNKYAYYSKEQYFCPICGQISNFEPFGANPRKNAKCPNCNSLERHRFAYLLLQKNYSDLINQKQIKLLDISPETVFYNYFRRISNIDYFPVAENLKNYESGMILTKKVNFENLPWEDNTFDIIYNSHVLQNVKDDIKVMNELCRVLKKDGICITLVQYSNIPSTIEKNNVSFDSKEHVSKIPYRKYGLDFKKRLNSCGFDVIEVKAKDIITSNFKINAYRLQFNESIFICTK